MKVYREVGGSGGQAGTFLPSPATRGRPSRREEGEREELTRADRDAIGRAAQAILALQAWQERRTRPVPYPGRTASEILEEHAGGAGEKWQRLCSRAKALAARQREQQQGSAESVAEVVEELGLPGVGPVLAARIAVRFPTRAALQAATPAALQQVDGIGPERARRLHGRLQGPGEAHDLAARPACSPASPPAPQQSPREAPDG